MIYDLRPFIFSMARVGLGYSSDSMLPINSAGIALVVGSPQPEFAFPRQGNLLQPPPPDTAGPMQGSNLAREVPAPLLIVLRPILLNFGGLLLPYHVEGHKPLRSLTWLIGSVSRLKLALIWGVSPPS